MIRFLYGNRNHRVPAQQGKRMGSVRHEMDLRRSAVLESMLRLGKIQSEVRMTATAVYGVRLADQFKDPEGNLLQVEEFITPPTHSKEWKVRLHFVEDESLVIEVDVKDLKQWEKVTQ
jgi:hypothetical protein